VNSKKIAVLPIIDSCLPNNTLKVAQTIPSCKTCHKVCNFQTSSGIPSKLLSFKFLLVVAEIQIPPCRKEHVGPMAIALAFVGLI